MTSKITTVFLMLLICLLSLHAQQPAGLPHKFKEIRTGATLEAVREQNVVKLYILVDDIEQYSEILIERSDELQKNFSQCKEIEVEKGKYKNNYVELIDQYPLSSKMTNLYRIKAVTSEGIMKMFPPVPITFLAKK